MNIAVALSMQSAYKTFGGPPPRSFWPRSNGFNSTIDVCHGTSILIHLLAALLVPNGGAIRVFGIGVLDTSTTLKEVFLKMSGEQLVTDDQLN